MTEAFRQLVLCPHDPQWISTAGEEEIDVELVLRSVGLIAAQADVLQAGRFYIGERFLQHVNFMGCAPAVEFTPSEVNDLNDARYWRQFTFVHIPDVLEEPAWYADLTMAKPQCPVCHKRTALAQDQAKAYFNESENQFCCPHCLQQSSPCDLGWREFGGCARTLISIVNVYPKEAIPTENLLLQLEEQTQIAWRYFYYDGPLINVNES